MTSTNITATGLLKVDTKGRVRTPAADREALLDLFEAGSMTGVAFAQLHGLRYSTLMHWVKKRRGRKAERGETAPALFQEVVLEPAASRRSEGLVIELPMGARVRLERPEQIPLVAVLCRHLRENAPC